jgi:hypothetical protein
MKRAAFAMAAALVAAGASGVPAPLSFSEDYNCDGFVTSDEAAAVAAWHAKQAPDYAAAFYGANRNKYFKAPNVAFAIAGPWTLGGVHNTAFDNDLTWFYQPDNPARAMTGDEVATAYATYKLALGSGFDATPLPEAEHGVALPCRLNMVRFGLPRPSADSLKTNGITVNLDAPAALADVNFLLSGLSKSDDCRPRLRIRANYQDGATTNIFVSPNGTSGKPTGVPHLKADNAPWDAWNKTPVLQPAMYGNYMLSQEGTIDNPCRPDWKTTISGCMMEPSVAGLPLNPAKVVTGFTFFLNGDELPHGSYTGGEEVNVYAIAGTVVRPSGTMIVVR